MRCREVEALWDEIRDCTSTLREAVHAHLHECPPCQDLYEQYEGVAYCLSSLPPPEPSCDLAKKIVQHIAALAIARRPSRLRASKRRSDACTSDSKRRASRSSVWIAASRRSPCANTSNTACIVPSGRGSAAVAEKLFDDFFKTWHVDESVVDISDLTPFEQAALKAAAQIPPGEVRSYAWVAQTIGRPKAAEQSDK